MDNSDSKANIKELNLSLGMRIRSLRNKRKMKVKDLSGMTGLTSSMISQMERGIISPSIASLKKICDAMDIPISCLFEATGNEVPGEIETGQDSLSDMQSIGADAYLRMFPPVSLMGLSPVVRKENRKFLSPGKGIRFYLLNPNLAGPIELIYNEYDPGASTGPVKYTHPGSECGLILSGELIVEINDAVYTLKEGDSITFNCSEPHLKRNDSDKMCTCVWANVPPWF